MEPLQSALAARQSGKRVRSAPAINQEQNRQAAAVILADREKYGGEQAGLVRWATLVLAPKDAEPVAPEFRKIQSTLF
jgi:hypothetical protein